MKQSDSWVWHYLGGMLLFGFGMGMQFGYVGVAITLGVVLMLGGFGQFILTKVQKIVSAASLSVPSDQCGGGA